ncbi:hypothetical protein BJ166DRAFT_355813 [Pestalotiopsis sp. NC0098]|nr:hypothetical protein BJ166DRAFT_355813 [Pestalotiopsis sp. NC0098]
MELSRERAHQDGEVRAGAGKTAMPASQMEGLVPHTAATHQLPRSATSKLVYSHLPATAGKSEACRRYSTTRVGVVVSSSTLDEHERTTLRLACRWLMNVSMRFPLVTMHRYLQEEMLQLHGSPCVPNTVAVSGESASEQLYLQTLAGSSPAFMVRKQLAVKPLPPAGVNDFLSKCQLSGFVAIDSSATQSRTPSRAHRQSGRSSSEVELLMSPCF